MDNSKLETGLKKLGYNPTGEQLALFDRYYEMLVEKNKVMNLTAITEYDEVVLKHFVDSASILRAAENDDELSKAVRCGKILDLGTGAGFPGIPLKILFPDMEIVLMDSLNKRLVFLDEVIRELGLKGVTTCHARAEEIARKPEHRECYDLVVSRAVARLSVLSEFCMGFVKVGGYFTPYKAGGSEEEITAGLKAVETFGGKLVRISEFELPNSDIKRAIPVIKKVKHTPDKYPRVGKKAEKNPIE